MAGWDVIKHQLFNLPFQWDVIKHQPFNLPFQWDVIKHQHFNLPFQCDVFDPYASITYGKLLKGHKKDT
jgi:hypothetical protein